MKHKKLADALDGIQDQHILEAGKQNKHPLRWTASIAAVLAVCILVGVLWQPVSQGLGTQQTTGETFAPIHIDHSIQEKYIAVKAEYPVLSPYPGEHNMDSFDAWQADQRAMHNQPDGYADSLQNFWSSLLATMDTTQGNVVCSPVNIYMALSMLAETTGGQSRQQILDALGAESIEALRTQANQVWKAHYNDDGLTTSILANSLWLEKDYGFDQDTANLLAAQYYASVFEGDLGSSEMNQALQAWLDEQTGGLLTQQIQDVTLDPRDVLAIASTVYYQVQWLSKFSEKENTEGTFYGKYQCTNETFMNNTITPGAYYWTDNFGAVPLGLEDGSTMWLILPDTGTSPEALLKNGSVTNFLSSEKNWQSIKVNLSVPKFDISADMDLKENLQQLGITDVFQAGSADFSPILTKKDGGCIDKVKHAARVGIDEKGVTAAAFTVIFRAGAGMSPNEEIDFVLDRPFLFVVESQDGLPLFTGIVNEP